MNKNIIFVITNITLVTLCLAIEPAKAKLEQLPKLRSDEVIRTKNAIPYLGGRQSPGDIIGMIWTDMQVNCTHGQRLMLDDYDQAHINWMYLDSAQTVRYCTWNARYANGSYYGEVQASPSWSGYVQLDITRDADPNNQRTVIAYHHDAGPGYYSWIDIDGGNLWGSWPNDPKTPAMADHLWPYIAVANNNNIIMATGDYTGNYHHLYFTTDNGNTWTTVADFDSCSNLTPFVVSSQNPGSMKVVFVHTQFINDSVGAAMGQLDQDVWYMLSTDGGYTWGPYTNLTNYQPYPIDSVRAYAGVCALFDNSDNLHIVWEGRRVDNNYWEASKIFHWDEVNDTITIVSSPSIYYNDPGGWWITVTGAGDPGAWRMPADRPELVVNSNSDLYCLWHGNDDYNDYSAEGYFNGEFYAAYSIDNGITWSDYVNLTNTRSPGAPAGMCMDEDYMTANRRTINDSIYLTYIEDKDSGEHANTEGIITENPVRCWVFHRNLITGIEEDNPTKSGVINYSLTVLPNPFTDKTTIKFTTAHEAKNVELKIYNISGRLVKEINCIPNQQLNHVTWFGNCDSGKKLPSGVYFLRFRAEDYISTKKILLLK